MKTRLTLCAFLVAAGVSILLNPGIFIDAAVIKSSYAVNYPWQSPITYFIDSVLSAKARYLIEQTLNLYVTQYVPSVSFQKSFSNSYTGTPLLYFRRDTTESLIFCENETVQIGLNPSGPTYVTLVQNSKIDCGAYRGWLLHLLMHALGFYHEHQRSDRANYVYVNNFNVDSNSYSLLTQQQLLLNTQPDGYVFPSLDDYDYESVMHYHHTALAISGKITIVPMPPNAISWRSYGHATNMEENFSPISFLSTNDIAALQSLFLEPSPLPVTGQFCLNGGTFYNWCACPPGFEGRFCETVSCIKPCQNGGNCALQNSTAACSCPTGYSGNFCEIDLTVSAGCKDIGGCPFWSSCVTTTPTPTCNCEPFPYQGPTCNTPIVFVSTTTTTTTTTPAPRTDGPAASTLSPTATFSVSSTLAPTTTPVACTFGLVIPTAKPRPYSTSTMYLRIALTDIYYLPDYSDLTSPNVSALQNFLSGSLRLDYTTASSGKYNSLSIVTIQPPYWGESTWFWNPSQIIAAFGCVIVDYVAVFSQPLNPKERQAVLSVTSSYSQLTVPVLSNRLGTVPSVSTRVSGVGYITPQNLVLADTTPCTIYAAETVCRNGGQCTSYDGITPSCLCTPYYSGEWCQYWITRTVGRDWPVWLIVFVAIAAGIMLLVVAVVAVYCLKRSKQPSNRMWFPPTDYQMYVESRRQPPFRLPRFAPQPDRPLPSFATPATQVPLQYRLQKLF